MKTYIHVPINAWLPYLRARMLRPERYKSAPSATPIQPKPIVRTMFPPSPAFTSLRILIEPLPALLPIPACVYHPLQKDTGPILGVSGANIERLLDREAGVEANAFAVRQDGCSRRG